MHYFFSQSKKTQYLLGFLNPINTVYKDFFVYNVYKDVFIFKEWSLSLVFAV